MFSRGCAPPIDGKSRNKKPGRSYTAVIGKDNVDLATNSLDNTIVKINVPALLLHGERTALDAA